MVPKSTVYLILQVISLVLCCQQKEMTNAYLTPKITYLQEQKIFGRPANLHHLSYHFPGTFWLSGDKCLVGLD